MKTVLLILLLLLSSTYLFSQSIPLKNGDLLFVTHKNKGLSSAINQVTQTPLHTHFSHVAMIEKTDNSVWVLQATSPEGTERIPLSEFVKETVKDEIEIVVYRIKSHYQTHFNRAISRAKSILGKPYNHSYILNDSSYYCSQFVAYAFAKDSIFDLNPMTFKNPKTGEFNQKWVAYYQKFERAIPEGKPGCNPNGMAASLKLKRIGTL